MTKQDCNGCRADFYNHGNNSTTGQCWMFDASKPLKVRFYVHRDSPMGMRSSYYKENRPSCYHRDIGVYVDHIPDYAK